HGVAAIEMLVAAYDLRSFDPVIDRGRIPGLLDDLIFPGGVADVLRSKRGFDLERLEGAGPCGHGFLAQDLRRAGSLPGGAVGAVDAVGSEAPALADGERRLD